MSERTENSSYRSLAKVYDLFELIFYLGAKGNPRHGLLSIIQNTPMKIIDLCVGTALSSIVLARQNDQNQIVGIDLSKDMISVAREKVLKKKLQNVELQSMSADALHFKENTFDIAMVSFALHEMEPALLRRVLREASRVVKMNGKLILIDFALQNNACNRLFMKLWTQLEPEWFQTFLSIDWRTYTADLGLTLIDVREYSFSNLYQFQKHVTGLV